MAKTPSKITLPVKIDNNKFASNLPMIKSILEAFNGNIIDITFHKRRNKRSRPQEKYYFAVVVVIWQNLINEHWGELWSKNEVHELLLTNCNYEEIVIEDTGEIIRKVRRSSENDTKQAEEFYKKCRDLAFEMFQAQIPLPNEELEIEF